MTARAVVDVDIDLAKAQRFADLFDKYTAQLDKTPNVWKNVGKEQAAMASQFERMTAAMMAQAEQAREEVQARADEARALKSSEGSWSSIARSSKSMAKSVWGTTKQLLKWSGILTGITGLIGGGALFGLDKMASGLGNERRTSMGLGMSVGGYRAFNLDFSKALDTDKFLGDVQEMMTNPGAAGPLWRMGVNPHGKTEEVAKSYLDRLRTLAVSTPTERIGLLNQQYGTSLSTSEWMRLHEMSAGEYGQMRDKNSADAKKLDVSDPIARKWQDFGIQLERAGMQIKNIFEVKLAKLEPRLEVLSERFVHFAEVLANSGFAEKALNLLAKGLDWLSKEIGSPQFERDVEKFVDGVGKLASGVVAIAKFLGAYDDDGEKSQNAPDKHQMWGKNAGFLGAAHTGEAIRHWIDHSVLGEDDWNDSSTTPVVPLAPRKSKGVDLSNIVGSDPTSWNPSPVSNTYASNRSNVNSTTNNYGGRGAGGSVNINITAPPGFSATTTLAGLNAGLA